jgi:tetratricopeptide (TPR) repeat protein
MDCRAIRSREGSRGPARGLWRWARRLCLVLCPAAALGCTPLGTFPLVAQTSQGDTPAITADDNSKLPRRTPRSETCVKAGEVYEGQASDEKLSAQQKAGLLDMARQAYQQALRLNPNNAEASRNLVRVYVKLNEHERAVGILQQLLQKHPKDVSLWADLALCQARRKDFDAALQSLGRALELDPENRANRMTYGHLLARAGRFDDALGQFTELMGPAAAHFQVARMQLHLDQTNLAYANLKRAVQIDPGLEPAQKLLAAMENGSPADAEAVQVDFEAP